MCVGRNPQPEVHGNPLDDEYTLLFFDFTTHFRNEVIGFHLDPARYQRASKCAGQSAAGSRNHIVDRRRMRFDLAWVYTIVLRNGPMRAKQDLAIFCRNRRAPKRPA